MKLSDTTAKLTCGKSKALRILAGTAAAAAALTLAAPTAAAQHVAFGVQIGTPGYYAPAPAYGYYARDPYAYQRYQMWRQHEAREAWERRMRFEEWQRDRRYDAYRYNHVYANPYRR